MVFRFTIDNVTNKYIPSSQVHKLPKFIRHILGSNNNKPRDDYFIWLEILIASFCGILLLEGVFRSPNVFTDHHHAPIIIASYGATAILCFNASQAPLAQPRNILFGHFLSSLIGICIEKLFLLSQTGRDHYYVGGAISVGLSSVVMLIMNCVHPPAGASALLPFIDEQIREMSWWLLPTHLISSILIIAVACLTGNVIRKYPTYWWTPVSKAAPVVKPPIYKVEITKEDIVVPPELSLSVEELQFLESIQSKISFINEQKPLISV